MVASAEGFMANLDFDMKNVSLADLDTLETVFVQADSCRVGFACRCIVSCLTDA